MPRYIDADALNEDIKRIYCTDCNNYNEIRCRACGTDDALRMIDDAPTADVVEVVRCKDCVNRVQFDTNKFHCEITGYYCGETGYCSDGVRKTE
jgi:hypothetical protein